MNRIPSWLTIRRAAAGDAEALARMMSDPQVAAGLLQLPYQTEAMWRQRIVDGHDPARQELLLVAERDGQLVGNGGLRPASVAVRRQHAAGLGLAVAGSHQGQGVGTALMAALCDYADHWTAWSRIELTVFTDNHTAIRLYERFGFVREGVHRGYALRGGRYSDVFSMARLHPSPPRLDCLPVEEPGP
jgi:putative acetyltransferase